MQGLESHGASGGIGGFGGSPAVVGVNEGNGVDFFLLGQFDSPGNAFCPGPGGIGDVGCLSDSCTCFTVATPFANIPPIFINPPSG